LKTNSPISSILTGKKLAILLLLAFSTVGSFATLGDGKLNRDKPKKNLFANNPSRPNTFSLRSGYDFRGKEVINPQTRRYINLNTVVTYQQGNNSYVLPVKKKVVLEKITFNPNEASRNFNR